MSAAFITQGIGTVYNASTPLKNALPGGLHHDRAPEGKATRCPYATFEVEQAPSRSSFGTRTADFAVRFIANADTDEAAATAMAAIELAYADKLLPRDVANGRSNTETYYMHEAKPGPLPDGVNEAGADPWQYILTLIFCCRFA